MRSGIPSFLVKQLRECGLVEKRTWKSENIFFARMTGKSGILIRKSGAMPGWGGANWQESDLIMKANVRVLNFSENMFGTFHLCFDCDS